MGQVAACACISEFRQKDTTPVALRARVLGMAGPCIELEVVLPLADVATLSEGDVIGGQWQELCPSTQGAQLGVGQEVLAVFEPGNQTSDGCREYRSCSEQRCGLDSNATGFDTCDSACVESTRSACAEHTAESRVGGLVRIAELEAEAVVYDLYGQQQTATLSELSAPTCREEQVDRARQLQLLGGITAEPASAPVVLPQAAAPECPPAGWERP